MTTSTSIKQFQNDNFLKCIPYKASTLVGGALIGLLKFMFSRGSKEYLKL